MTLQLIFTLPLRGLGAWIGQSDSVREVNWSSEFRASFDRSEVR